MRPEHARTAIKPLRYEQFTQRHKAIFIQHLWDALGTAIGEASLCWSEPPAGNFDDKRSKQILYRVMSDVLKLIREET